MFLNDKNLMLICTYIAVGPPFSCVQPAGGGLSLLLLPEGGLLLLFTEGLFLFSKVLPLPLLFCFFFSPSKNSVNNFHQQLPPACNNYHRYVTTPTDM